MKRIQAARAKRMSGRAIELLPPPFYLQSRRLLETRLIKANDLNRILCYLCFMSVIRGAARHPNDIPLIAPSLIQPPRHVTRLHAAEFMRLLLRQLLKTRV